jgi:hypothetical protein
MYKRSFCLLAAVAGQLVSGCASMVVVPTPYVQGLVVDAFTGKPIGDAYVQIKGRDDTLIAAAADGTFVLRAVEGQSLAGALRPAAQLAPAGTAVAGAPGYEPREIVLRAGINTVVVRLNWQE